MSSGGGIRVERQIARPSKLLMRIVAFRKVYKNSGLRTPSSSSKLWCRPAEDEDEGGDEDDDKVNDGLGPRSAWVRGR